MKDIIIKYLFLSYRARIAGKDFFFLRAVSFIVPVFCLAVLGTLFFEFGWLVWLVFFLLILLTFPIIKVNWLNWAAVVLVPLAIGASYYFTYEWWEPIPFLYFALGILVDRSRFLFFNAKYADLKDWEQQLKYLRIPEEYKTNDKTEPVFGEKQAIIKDLEAREEIKYGAKDYVNVALFLMPFVVTLITIILLIIFQDGVERFPDRRFF